MQELRYRAIATWVGFPVTKRGRHRSAGEAPTIDRIGSGARMMVAVMNPRFIRKFVSTPIASTPLDRIVEKTYRSLNLFTGEG